MKGTVIKTLVVLALSAALASCSSEDGSKSTLPAISGKTGEIGVIATRAQWEAEIGNSIREVLAAEYPYLPQKEPYYRLFNVPEENFNKVFRVFRFADIMIQSSNLSNKRICSNCPCCTLCQLCNLSAVH